VAGGRDTREQIERLTVIIARLSQADGRAVSADDLLELVTYGAEQVQDRREQLRRDITHLVRLGWDITNVAPMGETARWRLVAVDPRLRVELDEAQRDQLERLARIVAATSADGPGQGEVLVAVGGDLGPLDQVHSALQGRCLLRFTYKGVERSVHPYVLWARAKGWYLTAREEGAQGDGVKTFVVARMSDLDLGEPGTAEEPPPSPPRPDLDPLAWERDAALEAVVSTTPEHLPLAQAMLGRRGSPATVDVDGDVVRLVVTVTSREAFLVRLARLGTRVRLEGPAELREQLRDRLLAVAEGAS
jgi:predicted DNA-binding transcriptional regulator YafY